MDNKNNNQKPNTGCYLILAIMLFFIAIFVYNTWQIWVIFIGLFAMYFGISWLKDVSILPPENNKTKKKELKSRKLMDYSNIRIYVPFEYGNSIGFLYESFISTYKNYKLLNEAREKGIEEYKKVLMKIMPMGFREFQDQQKKKIAVAEEVLKEYRERIKIQKEQSNQNPSIP